MEWAREQHPYPLTTSRPSVGAAAVLVPAAAEAAGAGGVAAEAGGEAEVAALPPSAKEGTAAVVGADRLYTRLVLLVAAGRGVFGATRERRANVSPLVR